MKKIACIIPTFNAELSILKLLQSLQLQDIKADIFLVDSTSTDRTVILSEPYVKSISTVPTEEFNHGGTRQLVINSNPDYDIYVFLTQDAILSDHDSISKLLCYFDDNLVGGVMNGVDAYSIDVKLDDGVSTSGSIRTINGILATSCVSSGAYFTNTYALSFVVGYSLE